MLLKYLSIALGILLFSIPGSAQYTPSKVKKKAEALYTKGLQQASEGDIQEGIRILKEAVKIDPGFLEAYLSIGGMFGELKNYPSAIENFEKAKAIDHNYFTYYSLPYAINLAGMGEFEKALAAVNEFLSLSDLPASSRKAGEYRKRCFGFAVEYAKNNNLQDYRFEPKNMGDSVNSQFSEYFPTITIDGRNLVFTRRVNGINEDFYSSSRTANNEWTKSRSLLGNINTNQNEGAQNISQDGEWLIFTGCNFPEGYGSCDLYISYLTPDGWSAPENLGPVINTEAWESAPSLSPDKRDLYFSSNRPGGFGGSDIYIARRLPNGSWSEPRNAGPEINTAGDESAPFIHADNQTLYFNSNGHTGYGDNDLFVVRKKTQQEWSKAENLGYPINTIGDEGSLVIAADGKTAYYASNRSDSRGGLDLYTFELRASVRPAKTLWVKGKVFDKKTLKGLPSAIELTDLNTRDIVSKVQTDETGAYLVTLPIGKDYAFNVNRKGYLFFSENFPLSGEDPDSTYHIDIPLQPLEADASIILKNIFFDVNQFTLRPESFAELDNVVRLLTDNPSLKISINGHTDNTGNASDNLKLSKNRAGAVVNYLVGKGVQASHLSAEGFGASQPVADNQTEEGKAKNRRTELKVRR